MSSSGLIRTVSFQPSSVRLGRDDDVVPGDPVEHLHVVQVEVDRVGVHAVVRDLPDLGAVVRRSEIAWTLTSPFGRLVPSMTSVGGATYGYRMTFCRAGVARDRLEAQVGRHPPELVERRRVHLVVERLGLERDLQLRRRALQVVEPEQVVALLVDPCEAVALVGAIRVGAVAAGGKRLAVGGVVGGLADDDRVLAGLEDTAAVSVMLEGVLELREVERRGGGGRSDLDLHDGPGVRAVAGDDLAGARVRCAGVVVVRADAGGECRGRVVVEDQRLARELAEVDDRVGALSRGEQERVLVDVAHVEAGRIGDPRGRLLAVDDGRGREEAALGADLDPVGASRAVGGVGCREDVDVGLRGGHLGCVQGNLGRADELAGLVEAGAGGRSFAHVPLEVEEAVIGRVQDPEAVGLRLQGHGRVGRRR